MAIVDDKRDKKEDILIDPFDTDLDALAEEQIDKDADAYESVKPPRAGRYNLKIVPAKNGYSLRETDNGDKYYQAKVELYIIDAKNPEDNGVMIDGVVSTYLARGKKISTAAYLMMKTGYPSAKMPDTITHKDLIYKFGKWFQQGDKVVKDCLCDWQAWSKAKEKVIFSTEKDFPVGGDGEPTHIVQFRHPGKDGGTEELIGRLKRKDWGPSDKTGAGGAGARPKAPAVAVKAAPKPAPKPVVEEEDEEGPVAVVKTGGKVKAKVQNTEDVLDEIE